MALTSTQIAKAKSLQEQLMKLSGQARDLQYALDDLLREIEGEDAVIENSLVNAIGLIEGFASMDCDLLPAGLR